MKEFDRFLNKRIWDKDRGVSYFCRICGTYKPEKDFYKRKGNKFGLENSCKLHHTKKDKEDDNENSHLKLNKVTEKDFVGARKLLQSLGYDTTKSVHEQFKKKYNL